MTAPTLTVEVGFGSTWQTEPGSISWTDVTSYVLHAQRVVAQRGASAARGVVDPGDLRLGLLNTDRRFDPTHTTGPYFGDLLPGVPIRLTATPAGQSTVSVWYGTVKRWPQRFALGDRVAWVPLECWDGFADLARAKIPRSVLEAEILADSPVAFWPLDETSGTVMVDRATGYDGEYNTGTTAQSSEVEFHRGINFATSEQWWGHVDDETACVGDLPLMVEMLVAKVDPAGNFGGVVWRQGRGNAGDDSLIYIADADPGGAEVWAVAKFASTDTKRTTGGTLDDGDLHHIAYKHTASDQQIYLDGVEANYTTNITASTTQAVTGTWIPDRPGVSSSQSSFEGWMAAVAVFNSDVSEARIQAHAAAALAPLDDQRTDQRIDWILDELDWPDGLRDLEAGNTTLGPATFRPGDNALEYLRLVSHSEDGRLFTTPDGKLRFVNRYWRWLDPKATTSQFTFSDQGASYAEFELELDDELLCNIARFARRGGSEQVAVDAASVAAHGEAERQQSDLLQRTDVEVRSLAQWMVATQSAPQPRVPKIRVPLHDYSPADQAAVLALDLGYRVTVTRTPPVGDPIILDLVIDGIRHDVASTEWWWEAVVSPAPDMTATMFVLGTSELSSADILGY